MFTQMGFCGWRWMGYPQGMDDRPTSTQWMARAAEARSLAERMRTRKHDPRCSRLPQGMRSWQDGVEIAKAVAPTSTDIYRSSNGDRWRLISDSVTGRRLVRHEANLASGGQVTEITVEEFLAVNGPGPEDQALRRILGSSHEQAREVDR